MRHEDRPDHIPVPRLFLRIPVIDPQGQQIIFVHAGDLWLVPANGGEARRLTQHPAGHAAPRWSHDGRCWLPDGQSIIFTTGHASGMSQVARIDLRPLPSFFREAEFEKLFPEPPTPRNREPLSENEPNQSSDPVTESGQPEPSEPAKTEPTEPVARAEKPKHAAIEIQFARIDRRLRLLTTPQFSAVSQAVSPDSRDLIVSAGVIGKINLWLIPLDQPRADQPPRQLTNTSGWKASVCFGGDGKQMLFLDGGQIVVRKHPNGEPIFPAYSAEMTYGRLIMRC
jgi:hypothetical protein